MRCWRPCACKEGHQEKQGESGCERKKSNSQRGRKGWGPHRLINGVDYPKKRHAQCYKSGGCSELVALQRDKNSGKTAPEHQKTKHRVHGKDRPDWLRRAVHILRPSEHPGQKEMVRAHARGEPASHQQTSSYKRLPAHVPSKPNTLPFACPCAIPDSPL